MDDRYLDEFDDINDEMIEPVKQRIRKVNKNAKSVAEETRKKGKQLEMGGTKQKK